MIVMEVAVGLSEKISRKIQEVKAGLYFSLVEKIIFSPKTVRNFFIKKFENNLYSDLVENNQIGLKKVQKD